MGWFDEQIKQRMQSDEEILEDSFFRMAGAVLDRRSEERMNDARMDDRRAITREALDDILRYFHKKPAEIPDGMEDPAEQLACALRPTGLMTREVKLEQDWRRSAFGPMLGMMKDTGELVALMPGTLTGYWYRDPDTGRKLRITRRTEKLFAPEALCFYEPLPMKKLGIPDLMRYMGRSVSRGDLLLILIASLSVTLVGKLEPRIYSLITGPILRDRRLSLLAGIGFFLVASAFAGQMLNVVRSLLMERINTKTSVAVESSVMMRILSLPVSFFRRFSSGELSSRASSVSTLCAMLLNNVLGVGLSSLLSLLYVGDIFRYAPALVWPSLGIILATVALSTACSFVQVGITRKKMELSAQETGMTYAMLGGMQKIRLSGSEKRMFARWGRLYAKTARLEYNPPAFIKLNRVMILAVTLLGTVMLYSLAAKTGVRGNEYYAFSAAYGRVSAAFGALAGIAVSAAGIRPVLEMAEPILQAEPEVATEKETVDQISGGIEMSHVTFRYDEHTPYVLNDLSLKIRPGEYVAVVGRTGCGKSTLVRLLLGFEQPEKGAIFYDRHDLASMDPRSLRKHIGTVLQTGELCQGDIYSNIAISAPRLTLNEAWEAAEIAGIADDIREMPMGMQTVISEGQGGISGGQKQRLMIARAVAPKPKILIFDEATSALDNKTQKQVSDALAELKCTRLVVAHRLSTIRGCDRILVLDQGRIAEEGDYETLLARKGVFANLVERQRM